MIEMPPAKITIRHPDEPYEEHCWYVVRVAFNANNPIHRAVLYVGFLTDNKPGNYSTFFCPTWNNEAEDAQELLRHLHFFEVERPLGNLLMGHIDDVEPVEPTPADDGCPFSLRDLAYHLRTQAPVDDQMRRWIATRLDALQFVVDYLPEFGIDSNDGSITCLYTGSDGQTWCGVGHDDLAAVMDAMRNEERLAGTAD